VKKTKKRRKFHERFLWFFPLLFRPCSAVLFSFSALLFDVKKDTKKANKKDEKRVMQ